MIIKNLVESGKLVVIDEKGKLAPSNKEKKEEKDGNKDDKK